MTAIAARPPLPATPSPIIQLAILFGRLMRQMIVAPTTYINLMVSLFFLAVYTGAFGASVGFEMIIGADFLTFIIPVSIVNASLAGAISGQLLVEDMETGYLRRLQAMPVRRVVIVLAPMLVGALLVLTQAGLVVVLGVILGVDSATGLAGLGLVLLMSLLWGMAFAGYAVATGLMAGNAAAAQAATIIFFPLVFLAPTFMPRDQLQGWLQVAAAFNPTTYVLETMRGLLITGWDASQIVSGFAIIGALCLGAIVWAATVAKRTTSRR